MAARWSLIQALWIYRQKAAQLICLLRATSILVILYDMIMSLDSNWMALRTNLTNIIGVSKLVYQQVQTIRRVI